MESNIPVAAPIRAASTPYKQLAGKSRAALEALMVGGETPSLPALVGFEYRGYNVAPALALLGIRKFIKAFHLAGDGRVLGCNTPVAQNGLRGEWLAKPSEDKPRRYAFFLAEPGHPPAGGDGGQAALLDYGRGGNAARDPARLLRDYLVRVEPGSDELLLGKAYLVVAGRRTWHSYFVIERLRQIRDSEALASRADHGLARP
jgi:hypothetical protein